MNEDVIEKNNKHDDDDDGGGGGGGVGDDGDNNDDDYHDDAMKCQRYALLHAITMEADCCSPLSFVRLHRDSDPVQTQNYIKQWSIPKMKLFSIYFWMG